MNEIEAFVKSVNGAVGIGITVEDFDNVMEGDAYTKSGVSGSQILDLWYVWKDGVFLARTIKSSLGKIMLDILASCDIMVT